MLAAVGPGATILVLAPGLSTRCMIVSVVTARGATERALSLLPTRVGQPLRPRAPWAQPFARL